MSHRPSFPFEDDAGTSDGGIRSSMMPAQAMEEY